MRTISSQALGPYVQDMCALSSSLISLSFCFCDHMSNAVAWLSLNILYIGGFLAFSSKKSRSLTALDHWDTAPAIPLISRPTDTAFLIPLYAVVEDAIAVNIYIILLSDIPVVTVYVLQFVFH